MVTINIVQADLQNEARQRAVLEMLDRYSRDPMGDAQPLSDYARAHLIRGLQDHPTTMIFLAYADEVPVGIATCFRGFSTFAARPQLNISDFFVMADFRGQGIGRQLLEAAQGWAKNAGCCRLTLEVQENNSKARAIYARFGFAQAVYPADQAGGGALYLMKWLEAS